MKHFFFGSFLALASLQTWLAHAETTSGVTIEGIKAALLLPDQPKGAIILLAGGDGKIGVRSDGSIKKQGNQLVRTRAAYAKRGFAVLVPEGAVHVKAAVDFMKTYGTVTLVGTSRGTLRAARGIAVGAQPDRLVLTSGFLSNASGERENVISILGSPTKLPMTLVVHHKRDGCKKTQPAGVEPFLSWAKPKARMVWLDGGRTKGNPCRPWSYHGFNGIDDAVVDAVSKFAAP
jgi:hypothetical protein